MAAAATRVYLFHMRACHSGAAFAMAFPHCSQQAFLEAHVQAFDWFGGVFGLVRYNSLASAQPAEIGPRGVVPPRSLGAIFDPAQQQLELIALSAA